MFNKLKSLLTDRNRQRFGLAVAAILLAGGFFALGYGLGSQQSVPRPTAAGSLTSTGDTKLNLSLGFSKPISIKIPAINVNSQLITVGKNPDGTIEIPKGAQRDQAAWYKYSSAPGQSGAAVIEGHVDTYSGPSVFFDLGKLQPGDTVKVTRADGKTAIFSVDAVRLYPKKDFPTNKVYEAEGDDAELHLITCGGNFNQATDSYTENTVVYSKLVAVN